MIARVVGKHLAAVFTRLDTEHWRVNFSSRSEIVGRPLAAMLANDGADVYSIDISSAYLMKRGKITEVTFTSSNTLP